MFKKNSGGGDVSVCHVPTSRNRGWHVASRLDVYIFRTTGDLSDDIVLSVGCVRNLVDVIFQSCSIDICRTPHSWYSSLDFYAHVISFKAGRSRLKTSAF